MSHCRVALVVVNGLCLGTAARELTRLEQRVRAGAAARWSLRAGPGAHVRPFYETLHTGLSKEEHGVKDDTRIRSSNCDNTFSIVRRHGGRTAASAHAWISELYNGAPFNAGLDSAVSDERLTIQYGRFYQADDHPDEDAFHQGLQLADRHGPDYLLIQSAGLRHAGRSFGAGSAEYVDQARFTDDLLADAVPKLLAKGYLVLITADHGPDEDRVEAGTGAGAAAETRDLMVPLYALGVGAGGLQKPCLDQRAIAPTVLSLMGLPVPVKAQNHAISGLAMARVASAG